MRDSNLLEPLDISKIPNYQNLDSTLLEKAASFDEGNKYAIPYFWGLTGLIYNKRYVPDEVINSRSWNILGNAFFYRKKQSYDVG